MVILSYYVSGIIATFMLFIFHNLIVSDPQKEFTVGYHYYLRPEECVIGLNLLEERKFTPQLDKHFDYPTCKEILII